MIAVGSMPTALSKLAIRLLVTSESPLLELSDIRAVVAPFDPASLTWPWRHQDPAVDALQVAVMRLVGGGSGSPRADVFRAISALAREHAGLRPKVGLVSRGTPVPCVSEPWYCCAEPMESL